MHYAASVSSAPVFKAGQVHFPLFLMGYLYDPVGRINLDPIPGFDAVSYTHLDVYKRQPL